MGRFLQARQHAASFLGSLNINSRIIQTQLILCYVISNHNKYIMSKNNRWAMDPTTKENIKNKINAQIDKMKIAESKGDTEAIEKIMILKERIRLIDSYRPFDETRVANLQKIFKHYCTHIFKTGKNMSFDRIQYQNQHMIIERFFAFISDFKLNEIPVDDVNKQLTNPNNIILLFKKCSSNARNLQFHQFVTCVERLFTLLFNQTENYDRRQQKLQAEKKKRAQQAKKREKRREIKLKKIKLDSAEKAQNQEQEEEQQESQEEVVQNPKNTDKKTTQSKPANIQPPQANKPNEQASNIPKSTQNDEMVKEMMKDFQIVNPTDQVKKAVKKIKKGTKKQDEQQEDTQPEVVFDPYAITDQQKIESYMLRIGLDNWKLIQKKMRYFQKANHKYTEKIDPIEEAMKIKQEKLKMLKKDELTHYQNGSFHEEWKGDRKNHEESHVKRLLSVKDKIEQIKMEKSKSQLGESLPKESYEKKKRSILQTFQRKQKQLMVPNALARLTKRKSQHEQTSVNFSLEMINRSTPHHLQLNKINPQRYVVPDPTDRIYMEQFGFDSFLGMKRSGRNDMFLAQETKKRAEELQNMEEKRMNRLTRNMYKKQQQNRESLLERRN